MMDFSKNDLKWIEKNLFHPDTDNYNVFNELMGNGGADNLDIAKEIYRECYDFDKNTIKLMEAGDVINSFRDLFKAYSGSLIHELGKSINVDWKSTKANIEANFANGKYSIIEVYYTLGKGEYKEQKIEKMENSNLANMYFHLITTLGNIMPWVKGFNPSAGELDIFQYKAPAFFGLCDIMGQKTKYFIDKFFLRDFVFENTDGFAVIKFHNRDILNNLKNKLEKAKENEEKKEIKEQIKKERNLYFYRASKAIMKRSYRILTKKEPTEEIEFTDLFADFCVKKGIESEIGELIAYLIKKEDEKIKDDKFLKIEGKEISDELEELSELKNMLAEKSIEATN